MVVNGGKRWRWCSGKGRKKGKRGKREDRHKHDEEFKEEIGKVR